VEHPTFFRTTQIDGLSIFYREAGPTDGPTLLLLHGLPSSSRMFASLFARLSDQYRLIAPDYPGFGHSDWPDPKQFAYRTNVEAYPKWQAWMREKQPRLLVIGGKYDLSFDLSEPDAYRQDVPNAQVHVLDAGHFALDTAANEIAAVVRSFVDASR
jgi:pimeloyl-ACP methyl ester carboxylesterase